ncbi:MAG: hypothetical protein IT292_07060 [Deltaproteobacteria bacterium]|nr:hypothetical protein [Deltaproteobacteria bacterium]
MRFNIFLALIERKFFSFFHRPLDSSLFLRGSSFLEGTITVYYYSHNGPPCNIVDNGAIHSKIAVGGG